uniref:Uncharacterized protein n=1 Tax=Arion vulgaris TaxID=1028688 RepID=A0A0B7A9C0_9EUPU
MLLATTNSFHSSLLLESFTVLCSWIFIPGSPVLYIVFQLWFISSSSCSTPGGFRSFIFSFTICCPSQFIFHDRVSIP